MLVWFMHGASVRRVEYADPLRSRLIQDFSSRGLATPEFYSCFWGDLLESTEQLWDWVQQDLEWFKLAQPLVDPDDVFHYQQRREQLISGFFSDIFTYLNGEQGREVRRAIAVQLLNGLAEVPAEEELHIVAHSLGSVILWDILFSESYSASDPAQYVRAVIKGLGPSSSGRKIKLRSITTLGSPLLFFNRALNINAEGLKQFANRYTASPLRWVNVIHASDIFAYPLRASLELDDTKLYFQDYYLGERNFIKRSIGDFAMALGLATEHSSYWRSSRVSQIVVANVLGDITTLNKGYSIVEMGEFE